MSQAKSPETETFNEADRLLPLHTMFRMIRSALPEGAKISLEVKEAMQEATTEFIGFLTNHAVETYTMTSGRKTMLKEDLINTLKDVDFDIFAPPLKAYLIQKKMSKNPIAKKEKKELLFDEEKAVHPLK